MINFNSLIKDNKVLIHKGNIEPISTISKGTYKLNFRKDILKEVKVSPKKELKLIEPGNKIPIGNYHQIGQFCDVCDDVTAHVRNPETKNIRCLKCKTKTKHL